MAKQKVLAKVVQFYAGLDLMGSKMSSNQRDAELEVTPIGVKITSKKTHRVILIPWSNIKGVELHTRIYRIRRMIIEWVDPKSLKPDPKNPNLHEEDQIERLAKLIQYQGWRHPIIVSKQDGLIKAGHGRLLAALKLKLESVPVCYQDFTSEEQAYAFLVSDNAIASWSNLDLADINLNIGYLGPDFEIDLLGIKDFLIEPADKLEPGCDEDEVPEYVEPRTKTGDIYRMGDHRLLCGDSTSIDDVEKLMNGEKAEICFTSPPYSDQREYNGGKDLSTDHLSTFIRAAYDKVAYFVVNLGYSRKNGEVNPYWDDYIKEAKDSDLKFLSWNIWNKEFVGSVGNQTAMFAISHEWILVFGTTPKDLNLTVINKNAGELNDHSSNREKDGTIKKNKPRIIRDFSQLKTVINQTPQLARNHDINHPAMFPVELPEQYIEAMTDTGQFIYEPFGGSGSTLIACEKTKRKCFMMELDPHYCDVIISRWEKYSGKKAELEMARPKLDIDPEQVRKLAEIGCKIDEIADFFECDTKTIYNRFSSQIAKGKSKLRMSLRQKQLDIALRNGNVTMLIWLGKQMLGQVDRVQFDIKEIDDETFANEAKRRLDEHRNS